VACEECIELNAHAFRSPADLVHALQVAANEVERGVLEPVRVVEPGIPEQMAIRSALSAGALPDTVLYRFKCVVCGDGFKLFADTYHGTGGWTRNDEPNAA